MASQLVSPDVHPVRDHDHPPACSATRSFFNGCTEGKRFKLLEIIGKGSYGTVCSAVDNLTGEKVAIKRIQNVFDNVADATRILREIKLLRMLHHPDVVEIKHIMLPPDPRNFTDIYVVFELMESDLHTVIGANDDLTPDHHRVFLYQLLRGLKFIHEIGVLHRDLKPKNILANSDCKLKICDFGLARPYLADAPTCTAWTDYVATRWYRAPELCGCFYGAYSQAVDVWSIGCLFAETLLGKPLFPGRDAVSQLHLITDLLGKPPVHVIDRISNRKARDFLHALPDKPGKPFEHKFRNTDRLALDLLQNLLAFDANQRPSAAQALEHPYFNGLPKVGPTDCLPITSRQFEFELHKLSEADVRNLIYLEALHYHPHIMQQYVASSRQLRPLVSQVELDSSDDIRRQFFLAEHYGGGVDQGGYPMRQPVDLSACRIDHPAGCIPADQALLSAAVAAQLGEQQRQLIQAEALAIQQQQQQVYNYYHAPGMAQHSQKAAAAPPQQQQQQQHPVGLYQEHPWANPSACTC